VINYFKSQNLVHYQIARIKYHFLLGMTPPHWQKTFWSLMAKQD